MTYAKPFQPTGSRRAPLASAVKMATAHLLAFHEGTRLDRIIAREYGDDPTVKDFQTRTAAAVGSTSTLSTFSQTGMPLEYFGGLAASSAGLSALGAEGAMQFTFGNLAALDIATMLAAAGGAAYCLEGDPIPSRAYSITNAELKPKAFKGLAVFSNEVFAHSRPAIEQVVKDAMTNDIMLAFDTAMFDSGAASATRPAGLRNGISAGSASTATSLQDAMVEDVQTVCSAVSSVAGNGLIILVCAPAQAVALRLRRGPNFPYPILASSGVEDNSIIALAANTLISACDPTPRFEVSDQGTIHLDTAPAQLGVVGSPNVIAAKSISLFQQDSLALRVIFEVSYALRSTSGLSWLSSVKW